MKKVFSLSCFLFLLFSFQRAVAQCDPPVNLGFSYANNVSTFTWDAVPGAVEYKLQFGWAGANWGTTELTATTNTFDLANLMQGGDFQCRVRANCGTGYSAYTVLFFSTPCSTPGSLSVTNITTTSATLNWVPAIGNNNNTTFEISYRILNSNTAWTLAPYTTATSTTITNLLPGATYEWRVRKICAGPNSDYVTSQLTTISLPCGAPSSLSSSYTGNTAVFNWTAVTGAISYRIQFKYSTYSWSNIEYETTTTTNSLSLPNILQSATFDWRVNATCMSGTGAYVESQITVPCPSPTGLFTSNITSTSAILNWTPSTGFNSNVSDFIVEYRIYAGTNGWSMAGHSGNGAFNLNGLAANTTYEWRVKQTCSYFNSNTVSSQFTTQNNNGCGTPAGLTVSSITNTTAVLNWAAVPGANSYNILYKTLSATIWNSVTSNTANYSLSNLLVGTAYEFKVRTKCGSVYSGYSTSENFSTLNCISNGINTREYIDLFKLGTINRVSGAEPGGYISTGLSTNLVIGSNNNAGQISAGFNGSVLAQNYSVFIDYNRNGNFESTERVYGAGYIGSAGTCNFTFNVPSTATAGPAGLRVVMRRASDGTVASCLTGFLGETEDYIVNLVGTNKGVMPDGEIIEQPKVQTPVTVSPNPSDGLFNVSLPASTKTVSYEIFDNKGVILLKQSPNRPAFTIDITRVPQGLYLLKIIVDGKEQVSKLVKR